MSRNGLLIDYEYCTGCHICEVSCKNEHNLPRGQQGIKMTEVGPFQINADKWEWSYVAVPTSLCNLCEHRTSKGETPSCVLHCLGKCMEYGPIDELAAKMKEKKSKRVALFAP